jgi:hypothetical protein
MTLVKFARGPIGSFVIAMVLSACSSSGGGGGAGGGGHGSGGQGAGAAGTAGSAGTSGSAGSGAGGGVAGTAGSGGAASGGTSGGSSSAGSGGSASGGGGATGNAGGGGSGGVADCSSLPLCDTFESTASGAAPSSALWTLIPNSPGSGDTATIDGTMGAHGSAHSLKVVSNDRLYLRNSTVIGTLGSVAHVRFYVRFATALAQGHAAMIVTHPMAVDQYSQSNELRFGSQDNVFHWNTDSDAANIPDVSPNGDATSFKPVANTWYCVELTINTNGHLNVSVDGNSIAGLTEDGVSTANIDDSWVGSTASLSRYTMLADFNVGWDSYGAGALTLWYDDVALSSGPIGCQ